jgi:hypothetical protein
VQRADLHLEELRPLVRSLEDIYLDVVEVGNDG